MVSPKSNLEKAFTKLEPVMVNGLCNLIIIWTLARLDWASRSDGVPFRKSATCLATLMHLLQYIKRNHLQSNHTEDKYDICTSLVDVVKTRHLARFDCRKKFP